MKNFLRYFFGIGQSEEFANFTLAHFAPIAVAVAIIILIYRFRDRIKNLKNEKAFRYTLAMILINQ